MNNPRVHADATVPAAPDLDSLVRSITAVESIVAGWDEAHVSTLISSRQLRTSLPASGPHLASTRDSMTVAIV